MVKFRIEKDSLGEVKVDNENFGGPNTKRSIQNFQIGVGKFHFQKVFIEAIALLKKACAMANYNCNFSKKHVDTIAKVCDLIIDQKLKDHFPLVVWQTGSVPK